MHFFKKRRSILTIVMLSVIISILLIIYGINNIDFNKGKKQSKLDSNKFYTVIPSDVTNNTQNHYSFLKTNLGNIDNIFLFIKNEDIDYVATLPEDGYYCGDKDCIKGNMFLFGKEIKESLSLDKLFTKRKNNIYDIDFNSTLSKHIYFIKNSFPENKSLYVIYLNKNLEDSKQNSIVNSIEKLYVKGENSLHIALSNATEGITDSIGVFTDFNTSEILGGYINNDFNYKKDFKKEKEKTIKKRVPLEKNARINMECTSCVLVLDKLANNVGKNFFIIKNRYSKQDKDTLLIGSKNKSYIFGFFTKDNNGENYKILTKNIKNTKNTKAIKATKPNNFKKIESNNMQSDYINGIFFGDTHFTRGFSYFIDKGITTKEDYFKCFYKEDGKVNLLSGLDIVGVNLETSIADNNECVTSYKEIKFRTEPRFLGDFKGMGINTFNIANNHSYDCGNIGYTATKKYLNTSLLKFFGDGRGKESVILKRNIRGKKIAFIGLNTTTYSINYEDKINKIKELKKEGFIVIVNIHWGSEYKTKHNSFQENFAYKLVEAGANLIIGHHPHVIQDFEIYKGTPIYYSLGNFMFDQPFDETLKGMGVLFSVNNNNIITKEIYFVRNPSTYQIQCSSIR